MIETPSLRTRVTLVTVVTLVGLVVVLEAFVYLTMRAQLNDTLAEVLETRAAVVQRLARDDGDLIRLDAELTELGIPAVLRGPDGQVVVADPARRFDLVPPGDRGAGTVSRTVDLGDGATAEVLVSRAGVDATIQRILMVELIGSSAVIAVAAALLLGCWLALYELRAISPMALLSSMAIRTASAITKRKVATLGAIASWRNKSVVSRGRAIMRGSTPGSRIEARSVATRITSRLWPKFPTRYAP